MGKNHELAGKTVVLNDKAKDPYGEVVPGAEFRLEEYWDTLTGDSWMYSQGNPAASKYAVRAVLAGLPLDDDVVYGKIGAFGHMVHVSELGEVKE